MCTVLWSLKPKSSDVDLRLKLTDQIFTTDVPSRTVHKSVKHKQSYKLWQTE